MVLSVLTQWWGTPKLIVMIRMMLINKSQKICTFLYIWYIDYRCHILEYEWVVLCCDL